MLKNNSDDGGDRIMKAFICDVPKCGKIVEEQETNDYQKRTNDCLITIVLPEGDFCPECTRKLRARAARAAWDELKQTRKTKPKLAVAA